MSEQEKQQVIALGRLGWSLRRIQQETGVRRETASTYLRAAGIPVQPPGRRATAKPAIAVGPVTTDSEPKAAISVHLVTTDSGAIDQQQPTDLAASDPSPSASICEPFRAAIELGLRQGRNAMAIWQDLVSQAGFPAGYQTVKRFVRKLRGAQTAEACAVIVTAPGEEAQVDYGQGPMVNENGLQPSLKDLEQQFREFLDPDLPTLWLSDFTWCALEQLYQGGLLAYFLLGVQRQLRNLAEHYEGNPKCFLPARNDLFKPLNGMRKDLGFVGLKVSLRSPQPNLRKVLPRDNTEHFWM